MLAPVKHTSALSARPCNPNSRYTQADRRMIHCPEALCLLHYWAWLQEADVHRARSTGPARTEQADLRCTKFRINSIACGQKVRLRCGKPGVLSPTDHWFSDFKRDHLVVCLLVGCLTSQQHAGVFQGRICVDKCTCCHTEIEVPDQTFCLAQSQYTNTGPTSSMA